MALVLLLGLGAIGCEKVSSDVTELRVSFSWDGMPACGWGNPSMHVDGIPETTQFLEISMYDHAYRHDHGKVRLDYSGQVQFEQGYFKDIQGPCPPHSPGRYELIVKALDSGTVVIARGSMERFFPENQ